MNPSQTLLDVVSDGLRAAAVNYHVGVEEPPSVVLWPDPDGVWKPLVGILQDLMPELLVLGDFAPEKRTGPVIWLKCAIAGKAPEFTLPAGTVPILYLPGIARHELRNADQCRWEIQPLVELLYRGTVWTHRNGRDWTIEAFFQAEDGLALDLSNDEQTRQALRSALTALAKTPVEQLRGHRLEAADFNSILVGDTPRDVLNWMGAAEAVRKEWSPERWQAFRARCQDEFGFDPEKTAPIIAAEKLGRRGSTAWRRLWDRYCEAPALFSGVRETLDRAQPAELVHTEPDSWPAENEKQEDDLRRELLALVDVPPHVARQKIADLEQQHGPRRKWVWARLDEAPLAKSLAALHLLAESTRVVPSCESISQLVTWYTDSGWQADAAVLEALRPLHQPQDLAALTSAIRSVYAPWLEESARRLQDLIAKTGTYKDASVKAAEGECLLFVDGLRYDAGQSLASMLGEANLQVECSTRFAALPTVTPTAKPAVSPVADQCHGANLPPDFRPLGPDGKDLSPYSFGKALDGSGYQRLKDGELLGPTSTDSRGWLETGRIDSRGHELGAELAMLIPGELQRVVSLVEQLMAAGWRKVTIVTDHGWLLLPGGLEKHELPGFLVESRWSRCAAIKGQSNPGVQTVLWHWNNAELVAVAPGAKAFKKGESYAHGGVSLQECVTPVLRITAGGGTGGGSVKVVEVKWKRMRCAIELNHGAAGLRVDLRKDPSDAKSTVLPSAREIETDGQVSVLVPNEDLAGKKVTVVILDTDGTIQATAETQIGG